MGDFPKRVLAALTTGTVFFDYGAVVFWATPDRFDDQSAAFPWRQGAASR